MLRSIQHRAPQTPPRTYLRMGPDGRAGVGQFAWPGPPHSWAPAAGWGYLPRPSNASHAISPGGGREESSVVRARAENLHTRRVGDSTSFRVLVIREDPSSVTMRIIVRSVLLAFHSPSHVHGRPCDVLEWRSGVVRDSPGLRRFGLQALLGLRGRCLKHWQLYAATFILPWDRSSQGRVLNASNQRATSTKLRIPSTCTMGARAWLYEKARQLAVLTPLHKTK